MLPANMYPLVMRAIELIGQGRTDTAACALVGLTVSTLRKYIRETPELHGLYEDADARRYDMMADTLVEIDSHCAIAGVSDVKVMKVLSDNIKWFLSRKRPQQYGERITVENHITADRAIINALERGAARAVAAQVANTIDVDYTVVSPARQLSAPEDDEDLSQFI